MAYLDSADLLAKVKRALNRPTTDELFSDSDIYAWLSEGQRELVAKIATHAPAMLRVAPTALTSSDGGYTYSFPSGIRPLGYVRLYATRSAIPSDPLVPGVDFTWEGDRIRMPAHTTRTFADGGPWAQWVAEVTTEISASVEPVVYPTDARRWLVAYACEQAAYRANQDPTPWLLQQARIWSGNPADVSDTGLLGALKSQAWQQHAPARGARAWWHSPDLG